MHPNESLVFTFFREDMKVSRNCFVIPVMLGDSKMQLKENGKDCIRQQWLSSGKKSEICQNFQTEKSLPIFAFFTGWRLRKRRRTVKRPLGTLRTNPNVLQLWQEQLSRKWSRGQIEVKRKIFYIWSFLTSTNDGVRFSF